MFGKLKRYIHNVLVGADQEGNIVLGGKPDETISAHSARAAAKGNPLGRFMVWWLDKIQKNHGTLAEQGDLRRAEDVEKTEEEALNGPTPPGSR